MQRIEAYKKKGITINDYEKAKEIVETIKKPAVTVYGRCWKIQNEPE